MNTHTFLDGHDHRAVPGEVRTNALGYPIADCTICGDEIDHGNGSWLHRASPTNQVPTQGAQ